MTTHLLSKLYAKPVKVILFKLKQKCFLQIARYIGYWQLREKWVRYRWHHKKLNTWLSEYQTPLLSSENIAQYLQHCTEHQHTQQPVAKTLKAIMSGQYLILNAPMPPLELLTWHTDWRYNYHWPQQYFTQYNHYCTKTIPADVKYPWELSRLAFVVTLLEHSLLDKESDSMALAQKIIEDWIANNPLAYSVNWHPMEASIRAINLIFILDMVLHHKQHKESKQGQFIQLLVQQLILHGHFIWHNLEYTDIRGNHYTANIVSLYLIGSLFSKNSKSALKWQCYARNTIPEEIYLQFTDDGVNFEKSTAYHRVVTECMLLAYVRMKQQGHALPTTAIERLTRACEFMRDMQRPDGHAVHFGDDDSAVIFNFDHLPPRDHSACITLANVLFGGNIMPADTMASATALLLTGKMPTRLSHSIEPPRMPSNSVKHYPQGGIIIARTLTHHLCVDVGDIGMCGRGGHAHNDIFSFELSLDNQPFIIDSGCPTYTGDLDKFKQYRSTRAHNTVMIDNCEQADFMGVWRYQQNPNITDVHIANDNDTIHIEAKHHGYMRLRTPAIHCRQFTLKNDCLICEDFIEGQAAHPIQRFFYFHPTVKLLEKTQTTLRIEHAQQTWSIAWDAPTHATLEDSTISEQYGHEQQNTRLLLTTTHHHAKALTLTITRHPSI